MQTVMTMTEIWPMLNQQEASISKFINKSPVYICGRLPGENVLEWQVITAYRSVGLRSDGSYEMHQPCVSWGGSLPSWSTRLVLLDHQGRLKQRYTKPLFLGYNFRIGIPQKRCQIDVQNCFERLSSFLLKFSVKMYVTPTAWHIGKHADFRISPTGNQIPLSLL